MSAKEEVQMNNIVEDKRGPPKVNSNCKEYGLEKWQPHSNGQIKNK